MRLTLDSVRMRNFRIHENYVFAPARSGVTAIIGDNGHGKSSIIDGVAWALYGTKPNGAIKNNALKRIGAGDDEECYVEVVLRLDGDRTLKVRRSIKGRTVQCECWLDDVLEAGPAVSTADKWIPGVLGIDEEGFLSAVLVQQKQVGAVVSESASVRQRNIERLTGITAATNAVKEARDSANALRKAMDVIAPDVDGMDRARDMIARTEKEKEDVSAERSKLKDSLMAAVKEYGERSAKLKQGEDLRRRRVELDRTLDLASQRVRDLSARRDEMADKVQSMKAGLPSLTDYSELQKEYDAVFSRLQGLSSKATGLRATVAAAPSADDFKALGKRLKETAEPKADRDALAVEAEKCRSNASAARQRITQYRRSLKGLEDGLGDDMICPTCRQPVTDVSHVRDEFNGLISDATSDIEKYERRGRECADAIAAYDDAMRTLTGMRDDFERMKTALAAADSARRELDSMESDIKSMTLETKRISGKISDIKANRMAIDNYNQYSAEFERMNGECSKAEKALEDAKTAAAAVDAPSERSVNALRTQTEKLRARCESMKSRAIELKGQSLMLDERLGNARQTLENAVRQQEERARIVRQHAIAQTSLSVLSAFREHLASEAVPQITDYASDMLSRITNGRFLSVDMDERYTISVRRGDGNVLDVRMLSGGERDLVAICLRLAISMMLSGGEPSMIILDEVLTAMDDTMSSAILDSMQDSGHGQVIIIAHNDIVRQISDKVVIL